MWGVVTMWEPTSQFFIGQCFQDQEVFVKISLRVTWWFRECPATLWCNSQWAWQTENCPIPHRLRCLSPLVPSLAFPLGVWEFKSSTSNHVPFDASRQFRLPSEADERYQHDGQNTVVLSSLIPNFNRKTFSRLLFDRRWSFARTLLLFPKAPFKTTEKYTYRWQEFLLHSSCRNRVWKS